MKQFLTLHPFGPGLLVLLLSIWPMATTALVAADSASDQVVGSPISYWQQVRPIFQAHCQGCHQPAKSSGSYVMTSWDAIRQAGDSGEPAIVAGEPDESYLMQMITPNGGEAEMPQGQPPLSVSELELIELWISQGAADDTPASARVQYDREHPPQYSAPPVITTVRFSPDGMRLAISGYHEVLLHDVAQILASQPSLSGRLIGMSERIESVVFSPDGRSLAVAGGSPGRLGEVQVWDLSSRTLKFSNAVSYDTCYGASWSPDGRLIAFGCPDNSVRAIDAATGRQILFNGAHSDWVLDTVFSKQSDYVVSISRDRSMKLIEVATERFIDNITSITPGALKGGLHAVDRHPTEDHLLIGGADGTPKIYRMLREQDRKIGDDFNLIRKFPEMPGRIFDVGFRSDGKQIVAGSSLDGKGFIHIFDTESGEKILEMQNLNSAIYTVGFSPGGKQIASGGFSGVVYLHDAHTGERLREFLPMPVEKQQVASVGNNK
jgi:WD40 repeat protein